MSKSERILLNGTRILNSLVNMSGNGFFSSFSKGHIKINSEFDLKTHPQCVFLGMKVKNKTLGSEKKFTNDTLEAPKEYI